MGNLVTLVRSWINRHTEEELKVPEIDPTNVYVTVIKATGSKRLELYSMLAALKVDFTLVQEYDGFEEDLDMENYD